MHKFIALVTEMPIRSILCFSKKKQNMCIFNKDCSNYLLFTIICN